MIERRTLLGGGAAMVAGAVLARPAAGQEHRMTGMDMSMDDCIDMCIASNRMCMETANYAAKRGGALAAPVMLAMLAECAALCQPTANYMLRVPPLQPLLCRACASTCPSSAAECPPP